MVITLIVAIGISCAFLYWLERIARGIERIAAALEQQLPRR